MADRPVNILYLHAHDLGRYLQPYGYAIPTPNVQRLAERGLLFRHCHSAAPTCSPSRAALLTGQWPHQCGMFGLTGQGWRLNDYGQHLAGWLRSQGYATALSGCEHESARPPGDPRQSGYDEVLITQGAEDAGGMLTEHAAAAYLARDHDRPFFLAVGFPEPHRYNPGDRRTYSKRWPTEPDGVDDRYEQPFAHWPDNAISRREMANFKMGVAVMDERFGVVLDALEANGLADSTLVIATTDHGPGAPEMKCTLSDRGTGVMLILAGPVPFGGGRVSDALVSHLDLYPTLADLLGVPAPAWCEGESLLPVVRGAAEEHHDALFTSHNYHGGPRPMRSVRTRRYRYLLRPLPGQGVGVDGGPFDAWWREQGWAERPQPAAALFDLTFDPNEACNVVDQPEYAAVASELRQQLEDWMRRTGDPALDGAMPQPPQRAG